jgi:ParB family chromosome partitioning protein
MTKKRGLGKGLQALIPESAGQWESREPQEQPVGLEGLRQVPVADIVPNPHQPRAPLDESGLAELAASIAEHGLIQPVIVTGVGAGYQLIAGERRWRAAQQAGLPTIPAIVKEATPQEMLELALVENVQRDDLNPLEEATAYRQLMDEFGLTQEQVAERVCKSRSAVGNTVRLLRLPAAARAALLEEKITEGHGRALLALPTAEAQTAALGTVLKRGLNVRQTEELVRRLLGQTPPPAPRPLAPEIKAVQDRLQQRLGTRVSVSHSNRGGRIVIHYYSDEELESILEQITGE